LKPGGQLLTTGYTAGKGEFTTQFKEYLKSRQYGLKNKDVYVEAGSNKFSTLSNIIGMSLGRFYARQLRGPDGALQTHSPDGTGQYCRTESGLCSGFFKINNKILNIFKTSQQYSEERYEKLVHGWQDKLKYIAADNHNWTMIYCTK
jgi:hypothetical protein